MDHLFRECPVTVEVWTTLSLQNIIMNQSMDFVQWLTLVFEQLTPCQGRLFCCALWDIWGDRNRRIHEEKVSNGKEITNFISNYITELIGFEKRKSINFDGAYNESQNRSTSGIVARDAEGKVLLSCSEIHHDITSAFAVEAIACWKTVQIGVEKDGSQSSLKEIPSQ
ncbi:hypothetical protein GOBAR_DD13654 [Gossypium barbadense]|nr:hypothetical protein GOBAR_DD13654 [Gossypium barbadense]